MGLDDFTTTEEEEDDEQDEEKTRSKPETTKRAIASNIQARCMKGQYDSEIDDGYVTIHIEDMAMMFAVMTMDYEESDFQDLVTDDLPH